MIQNHNEQYCELCQKEGKWLREIVIDDPELHNYPPTLEDLKKIAGKIMGEDFFYLVNKVFDGFVWKKFMDSEHRAIHDFAKEYPDERMAWVAFIKELRERKP